MLPEFTLFQWTLAILAALGVGVSKSGLPGIGLFHVVVMAHLFPGLASTGIVLPLLIAGDIGAVLLFRRDARWDYVFRTLPPALLGVAAGWWLMGHLRGARFGPWIGGIVLGLAGLQFIRYRRPDLWQHVPHSRLFAWAIGLVAGVTTMLANAAGPVMAIYLLAVSLPKDQFVGTAAWFFLLINLLKVPFSAALGLITPSTLAFNAVLIPVVALGLWLGKRFLMHLPQRWFDQLVLVFAVVAAIKLLLS